MSKKIKEGCNGEIVIPADIEKKLNALPDIPSRRWADWQKEVLKKYYGKKPTEEIAKIIGKSKNSVMRMWSTMRGDGEV